MMQSVVEWGRRTMAAIQAISFPAFSLRRNSNASHGVVIGGGSSGKRRRRRKRRGDGGGNGGGTGSSEDDDGVGTSSCDSSVSSSTLPELEFAPPLSLSLLLSTSPNSAADDEFLDHSAERRTLSSVPFESEITVVDDESAAAARLGNMNAAGQSGSSAGGSPFSELPCEANGRVHLRNNAASRRTMITATTPPAPTPTPLEPAFLNESDYPPGWMVYHPVLGVVFKTEADKYDSQQREKQEQKSSSSPVTVVVAQEEEKKGSEKDLFALTSSATAAAGPKGADDATTTAAATSSILENKQPEDDHAECSSSNSSTDNGNDNKMHENGPITPPPPRRDAQQQQRQTNAAAAEFPAPVICSIAANG
jgi:hypothetical protein